MIISSLIASAVFSWALASTSLSIAGALVFSAAVGIMGAALIYGGVALSFSNKPNSDFSSSSPTYGSNVTQTQTNPDLAIPMLYGQVKCAGNRIWQDDNVSTTVKRIVAFAEGEIEDFTDIRLNDIPVADIFGISVKKYYGTMTQNIDSIIPGATHLDRCETVGSLRGVAYLAISVPRSDKIDGSYNLTTIVKGRKIRVYTSTTAYTVKYSENPAWVLLDFLTSYNGLGLGLNNNGTKNDTLISKIFDLNSFLESASFCDELVNGKPRFAFNMIFDSQTNARSLMDEIYRNCRGGLFTKNGKLQFKIDKAQPISKVFTADDIIAGSETFNTLPSEEHYDILKCVFTSPNHEWQQVEAYAEIPEYRDGVPIEHSINMYSCIDFEQASRQSWYYVNSKVLQPNFGSIQTGYKAYDSEVGDVIQHYSELMGTDIVSKITSTIDNGTGVFTVNWRSYDERLYSDELGSKEPRVLISNLNDIYAPPANIQTFITTQNQKIVEFNWTALTDPSIRYEIRQGSSWATSSLIATELAGSSYSTSLTQKGTFTYWIKAKTKYNYSISPASSILNVQSLPEMNEIVNQNILENTTGGTFDNTYIYNGKLKLNTTNLWTDLTPEKWADSGPRYYADSLGNWGGVDSLEGSYTSQVFDLGSIMQNIVSFDLNIYSLDSQTQVITEWRHSLDDIDWSDWALLSSGSFEFRYYQVRASIINPNGAVTYIDGLVVNVDVPDRKEEYTNREITNASAGLTINFATDSESKQAIKFNSAEPHVIPATKTLNTYTVVTLSNSNECNVKLYKPDGTLTTGNVNITVTGY